VSPTPTPAPTVEKNVAPATVKQATKKVTISCVKGKRIEKVTGVNPKCPAGYKKK
jgi:hypothetical protein